MPARVGGAKAKRRYRALNLRQREQGVRVTNDDGDIERGRFRFWVYTTRWVPIASRLRGENQLSVDAENSNAAAKKVVARLRLMECQRAGVKSEDGWGISPETRPYEFYMLSSAEVDPEEETYQNLPSRTRFYHYRGYFLNKPPPPVTRTNKKNMAVSYNVSGVAQVAAIEGHRFSVPFADLKNVKQAVEMVLKGKASIRSIQRQSMNDEKKLDDRRRYIQRAIGLRARARSGRVASPRLGELPRANNRSVVGLQSPAAARAQRPASARVQSPAAASQSLTEEEAEDVAAQEAVPLPDLSDSEGEKPPELPDFSKPILGGSRPRMPRGRSAPPVRQRPPASRPNRRRSAGMAVNYVSNHSTYLSNRAQLRQVMDDYGFPRNF